MARIRTIKPEFPQSETIGKLSRDARLLFIQLWTIADDSGRSRAASRMLASLLFPYDDDARELMDGWLTELERNGCINLYEVDGSSYLQIRNWLKHQKIDHPSESRFPEFREELSRPRENSRSLAPDLGPRIGKDLGSRKGMDLGPVNGALRLPAAPVASALVNFELFWQKWPHKIGKAAARTAFASAIKKTTIEFLLDGVARYQLAKPRDRPWCNPATWLTQERWLDEEGVPVRRTVFDLCREMDSKNEQETSTSNAVCDVRTGASGGANPSVLDSVFGPRR